jgi:hypothetical protein
MKQGPFKMKAKSPMLKALIGNQGNLNAGLRSAIEAAPTKMKKESMAPMKKESMAKMKKESSMKMMDKKSPAKRLVRVDGKLVKETPEMRKKRLADTSGARRRRQLKLKNSLLKPEAKIKKEKENEKKLLKDYNNPKREDPLANLTGPKKDEVKKETVNLVEKNPKKVKTVKKVVKKDDKKVVKKADPLTKNIMNTNQKGDEGLKATVKNKPKVRVVNKNKQGKVNVFSAKYKSMTNSQRKKFYGADYKTRK